MTDKNAVLQAWHDEAWDSHGDQVDVQKWMRRYIELHDEFRLLQTQSAPDDSHDASYCTNQRRGMDCEQQGGYPHDMCAGCHGHYDHPSPVIQKKEWCCPHGHVTGDDCAVCGLYSHRTVRRVPKFEHPLLQPSNPCRCNCQPLDPSHERHLDCSGTYIHGQKSSSFDAHAVAKEFHNEYESQAKIYGWHTQKSCKVEWEDLPRENRFTMIATVRALHKNGVIQ